MLLRGMLDGGRRMEAKRARRGFLYVLAEVTGSDSVSGTRLNVAGDQKIACSHDMKNIAQTTATEQTCVVRR